MFPLGALLKIFKHDTFEKNNIKLLMILASVVGIYSICKFTEFKLGDALEVAGLEMHCLILYPIATITSFVLLKR